MNPSDNYMSEEQGESIQTLNKRLDEMGTKIDVLNNSIQRLTESLVGSPEGRVGIIFKVDQLSDAVKCCQAKCAKNHDVIDSQFEEIKQRKWTEKGVLLVLIPLMTVIYEMVRSHYIK